MLKKVVKYTDYLGRAREKELYFNLNKAEIYEKEYSVRGGLTGLLRKIIVTDDQPELVKIFKELIMESVGEISPDGDEFIKSPEIARKLEQSAAYPVLFMELASDNKNAAEFINGIMPSDLRVDMSKYLKDDVTPADLLNEIEKDAGVKESVDPATVISMNPNK